MTTTRPVAALAFAFGMAVLAAALACERSGEAVAASRYGTAAGGDATVSATGALAYFMTVPGLDAATLADHDAGRTVFASSVAGVGPLLDSSSCEGCHFNGGRTFAGEALLKLSEPGVDGVTGGPLPANGFGHQLQPAANGGATAEGSLDLSWSEVPGTYGDGEPYSLRRPTIAIGSPYTSLPAGYLESLRAAPAVFGLGLLEAVPEATFLAAEDPTDTNGDGISGRAQQTWDVAAAAPVLGRFGWKAEAPSLRQQIAGAYHEDMGVTSSVFPAESCSGQPQDDGLADDPELSDAELDVVEAFIRTLAVPARRNPDDPATLRGEQLFLDIGCAGCHTPTLVTGSTHPVVALRNQTIHPFTDLLLHDMGADLADTRPSFAASASEWRTPPLWGLGLRDTVNTSTRLLHDGRARTVAEAILWHGGEALAAREAFRTLSADDRAALLQFLDSN